MSYSERVTTEIRLRLLQLLAQAPDYTSLEGVLRTALETDYGQRLGFERCAAETAWLHDMGLVTRLPVGATAVVVITSRGLDAARGLASVPGVASPVLGSL